MICTPIIASTTKGALKDIEKARTDLVELRLDFIRDIDIEKLLRTKKKKIITCRKKAEGGNFSGSENERIKIIKQALEFSPDFVDIELSCGKSIIDDLKMIIKKNKNKTKLIISWHDFKKTDNKKINSVFNKIKNLNPDIIKIVTFANSINDNLAIFDLIKKAKKQNKKITALCMGEKGEISRILSPIFGAELTFGSLAKGKESASGQMPADVLNEVYRIDELKNPKIFGLVGNPVMHSKGFIIHNKSFQKLKLDNVYVNFLVDDMNSFIKKFKSIIGGVSITIPYKTSIIKHLDKIDATAKDIGAVNTVVKVNNKLIGFNTDCVGAIRSLKNKTTIKNKNVLMIGAGGVARAIAFGIIKEKGKLIILNRTVKKAAKLAKELRCGFGGFGDINKMKNVDVLINCTSMGMFPKITDSPIKKDVLKRIMGKKGIVFDSIYAPTETKLLKDAKSVGLKTLSGLELFINQAAAQFKLWTNKEMPNVRRLI